MKLEDVKPREIRQSQKSLYWYEIPRLIKVTEAVNRIMVDREE